MRDETDPKSRFKFSQKLSRTCFSLPLIIRTKVRRYLPSRRYCIRLLKTFVVYESRICWIWIPRRLWISRNFLRRYLYVVYLTLVQKRQIDNDEGTKVQSCRTPCGRHSGSSASVVAVVAASGAKNLIRGHGGAHATVTIR